MSSLSCKLCAQQITFDNKHISKRPGKKIPLDIETNEPHDCPVRREQRQQQSQLPYHPQQQQHQEKRYFQCNKGCGQEIYFDSNNKSQSGKFIPLDKDTGLPHVCH